MSSINHSKILKSTPAAAMTYVINKYVKAGVIPKPENKEELRLAYSDLLDYYLGPATKDYTDVRKWLLKNVDKVKEEKTKEQFVSDISDKAQEFKNERQQKLLNKLELCRICPKRTVL